MSDIRQASLEPGTDRLPGIPAQAGPFAMLAACALWLAARWSELPARVPVHWNFRGEVDRTVARAALPVALPLLLGAAVCVMLLAFQLGIRHGAPRHAVRGAAIRLLLAGEYVSAAACCAGIVAPLTAGRLLGPMLALLFAAAVGLAVAAILSMRGLPRGITRNPDAWHGPFYADRDDPALFVPKRYSLGYTVNLAHRLAPALLLAILAVPIFALLLAFSGR